jgi:hypothetical protein
MGHHFETTLHVLEHLLLQWNGERSRAWQESRPCGQFFLLNSKTSGSILPGLLILFYFPFTID